MKKSILACFLVLAASSFAFADGEFDEAGKQVYVDGGTGGVNKPLGKLSKGVALGIKSDANGYAIITQHQQGTMAYGTGHDSTSLYRHDVNVGVWVTEGLGTDASGAGNFFEIDADTGKITEKGSWKQM